MTDYNGNLDKIDEALMTYDLSDEALEAAARIDGGLAMTIGYCATAARGRPYGAVSPGQNSAAVHGSLDSKVVVVSLNASLDCRIAAEVRL